jgi:hypothetical protein
MSDPLRNDDDVTSELARLRAQIAELTGRLNAIEGPQSLVFPARIAGREFTEQAVVDGQVVDSPGGRACDDEAHPTCLIDVPSDTGFVLELPGPDKRYHLRISGGSNVVAFKIENSFAGCGGVYSVIAWQPKEDDIVLSGTFDEDDLGEGAFPALAVNLNERGQTSHDLIVGEVKVWQHTGVLWKTNEDGTRIILFNGIDWENCTTDPTEPQTT